MKTKSIRKERNIKYYRTRKKLTQTALAKQMGFTRHEIYLYETRQRKIKVNDIPKMADILECSIEDIVLCFCEE